MEEKEVMSKKKKPKKSKKPGGGLLSKIKNRTDRYGGVSSYTDGKRAKQQIRLFETTPPYLEVPTHSIQLGGKWFFDTCRKFKGEECIVCNIMKYKEQKASIKGKELENVKPRSYFWLAVIDRNADDEGVKVKVHKASWSVFEAIGDNAEEYPDLTSKKKGNDIIIKKSNKRNNISYKVIIKSKTNKLSKEELEAIDDFPGLKKFVTYRDDDVIFEAFGIDKKKYKKILSEIGDEEEPEDDEEGDDDDAEDEEEQEDEEAEEAEEEDEDEDDEDEDELDEDDDEFDDDDDDDEDDD